jgi:hypothetical protein
VLAESTACAAVSEPYRQIDVLNTREFAAWLQKRSISLQWNTLHRLWQAAIIRPIAVLEPAVQSAPGVIDRLVPVDLGFDVPSYVDVGSNTPLATELDPGWGLSGRLSRCLLWHPFQLLSFMRLARILEPRMTLDTALFGRVSYVNTAEHVVSNVPAGLIKYVSSESSGDFERIQSLLLTIEPLVHAQLDNRIRVRPNRDESFRGYYDWIQTQDGRSVLSSVGLSLEAATTWHRNIAVQAQIEDPVEAFRGLLRHASRDRRERMSGKALRSHTLYDMAEILRRYLETYHETELLEEDDARHGPAGPTVKQRLYGARRTADFDRAVFRRIARRYEVDPQARMTWFVEGDTEEAFLARLAEHLHLDLPQSGVEVMNMKGLGALAKDQLRGLLERYRREETFAFITVDDDARGDHKRMLQIYGREGLASAGFRVWKPDFEHENFALDELASAATLYAEQEGVNTVITADAIGAEMESRRVPAGAAIERLLSRAHVYSGKGQRWGEVLADWLAKHVPAGVLDDQDDQRPILEVLRRVLRGQWSDFQATAQLCAIDTEGNVVRKATSDE